MSIKLLHNFSFKITNYKFKALAVSELSDTCIFYFIYCILAIKLYVTFSILNWYT